MNLTPIHLTGTLHFRIRFNTMHGTTGLYWRVLIGNEEYLAATLRCQVPTFTESSYDERAQAVKYHMAGLCSQLTINEAGEAVLE